MKLILSLSFLISSIAFADIRSEIENVFKEFSQKREVTFKYNGKRIDGYVRARSNSLTLYSPIYEVSLGETREMGVNTLESFSLEEDSYDLKKKVKNGNVIYTLKNRRFDSRYDREYVSKEVLKLNYREDPRFGEYISSIAIGISKDGRKNPELRTIRFK